MNTSSLSRQVSRTGPPYPLSPHFLGPLVLAPISLVLVSVFFSILWFLNLPGRKGLFFLPFRVFLANLLGEEFRFIASDTWESPLGPSSCSSPVVTWRRNTQGWEFVPLQFQLHYTPTQDLLVHRYLLHPYYLSTTLLGTEDTRVSGTRCCLCPVKLMTTFI